MTEDVILCDENDIRGKTILCGSPVKIIDIQETQCTYKVEGECTVPCCTKECPLIITIEDCSGRQGVVRGVPDEYGNISPLYLIEDPDHLLSRSKLWQYRLGKLSYEGEAIKTQGPCNVLLGFLASVCLNRLPDSVWRWLLVGLSGAVVLFGLAQMIASIIYAHNPLNSAEKAFFFFYSESKKELKSFRKDKKSK